MFALRRRIIPVMVRRNTVPRRTAGSDAAHHHGPPVPQSQYAKFAEHAPKNEGWESTLMWWYPSSLLLLFWIHAFEPDTDIRGWANAEARARLELRRQGMTDFKFGTHYQYLSDDELQKEWDDFSTKALRMVRRVGATTAGFKGTNATLGLTIAVFLFSLLVDG